MCGGDIDGCVMVVMTVAMVTSLLFFSCLPKEQEGKKEPETKPTEEPKDSEPKDANEIKQKEKVILHPVTATKWRVENSWGDDKGDKGYLMMSDEWLVVLDSYSIQPFASASTTLCPLCVQSI